MLCDKKIVPLRFANVVPPISIVNLTWIDFFKLGWDQAFVDLQQRLAATDDAYEVPVAPPDPYREYLKALYDQIVAYLQQTVFALSSALIELRAESSPDAVQQRQALPLAFFGQAGIDAPQNEHRQFASFHEAFEHYGGRVLLLGDPGAGKTTTLLAFVRDAVCKRLENPALPLPITAPISTWDGKTSLEDWLARQVLLLKKDDLVRLIDEGKALLALDGLDELGAVREETILQKRDVKKEDGTQEQEDVMTIMQFDPRSRFLNLFPTISNLIVSCRIKDYIEIGQKATLAGAVTLQPLDDVQMQTYLSNQSQLWTTLIADNALHEIARKPLVLSLLAYAFNGVDEQARKLYDLNHGDLRDKIFEIYVQRRYEHEADKRLLPYSFEKMTTILRNAAFANAADRWQPTNVLPAYSFAPTLRSDPKLIIEQAFLLHLIVPVGGGNYSFLHLLLHNYFAFQKALDTLNDSDERLRWNAVVALGKIGDIRAVTPLTNALLNDPIVSVREMVAAVFQGIGNAQMIEPLVGALGDPSASVRTIAMRALIQIGGEQAIESLISALNNPNAIMRNYAVWILGKIGGERVVKRLGAVLYDQNIDVRWRAVSALREIGTPEALAAVEAWRRGQKGKSDAQ